MKIRFFLLISVLILWGCSGISPVFSAEVLRREVPLNDGWSFAQVKPGSERSIPAANPESSEALRPGAPMVSEETLPAVPVRLPHDWGIRRPFDTDPETWGGQGKLPWRGVGWYSRTLTLTKENFRAGSFWISADAWRFLKFTSTAFSPAGGTMATSVSRST